MRHQRMLVIALALVGAMMFAGNSLASTAHSTWRGWCGGPSLTSSQFLANLDKMGATGSASKFYGIQSLNENLAGRVKSTFAVATLSRDAVIQNQGCSGGSLFGAGAKTIKKGTKVWIDKTSLRAKYPSGFNFAFKKGWKRISVSVPFRAQTSCTNPGKATVVVFVWVRVIVKPKPIPTPTVTPKQVPPGSCNVNNSPGAVVCSSFYVVVTCGGAQITINGSTQQEAIQNANQYVAQNCSTTVTPPPPPPVQPPPPPPVQPPPPPPPPLPPSVTITSYTRLNMVPAGKTSGPAPFTVNASVAGGSVTVDPGLGGVSDCNSGTPKSSVTFTLGASNNNLCVIYYAPNDAAQPTQDTITYTAIVGSAKDVKTDTFSITYPVRPQ